jgi:hypothetical protein
MKLLIALAIALACSAVAYLAWQSFAREGRSKDEAVTPIRWIRVFPDRFEVDSSVFSREAELEAHLRTLATRERLAINWTAPSNDYQSEAQAKARVLLAHRAASNAGFTSVGVVGNVVFAPETRP